jgi:hypothetical protein
LAIVNNASTLFVVSQISPTYRARRGNAPFGMTRLIFSPAADRIRRPPSFGVRAHMNQRAPVTNEIKEIQQGVFWALLDHPKADILEELLDPNAPFVLCWSHAVGSFQWKDFALPILDPACPEKVRARYVEFSFVVPTEQFLKYLPRLGPGIRAVQLNSSPQDHLDLPKIRGTQRWRLFEECGWHVFLDTPGNDFGEIASPSRTVVEKAITLASGRGGSSAV